MCTQGGDSETGVLLAIRETSNRATVLGLKEHSRNSGLRERQRVTVSACQALLPTFGVQVLSVSGLRGLTYRSS